MRDVVQKNIQWIPFVFILALGCQRKPIEEKSSKVSLTFPSAEQLNVGHKFSSAAAGSYDFSTACFSVNITASDISRTNGGGQCDIPIGVFAGFVAPGKSIIVEVPHGSQRKLELIAYQRNNANEACPVKSNLSGLTLSRLARVGLTTFEANDPEVTVNVTMSAPTTTFATQYSLPTTCQASSIPANTNGSVRLANGNSIQTGTGWTAISTISGSHNEMLLQGGNFKLRMSRRSQ